MPVPRGGVVISYDAARGLGWLRPESGRSDISFHSTAITDGSRSVEVGERVVFVVVAAHGGRAEAAYVTRLPPQATPGPG